MAAFGFAQIPILICAALAMIINTGTQAISGKCFGRGDVDGVNKIISLAVNLDIIIGAIFMAVFLLFSHQIARLCGATGDMIELASLYLKGIAPGLIFLFLGPTLTATMQMDGDPIRSFSSVAVMTAVNIILDLVDVLVVDWGMFGMALATTISNVVNILILAMHFVKPNHMIQLSFKEVPFGKTLKLFKIGLPAANQQLCMFARNIFLNIFLLGLAGSSAVAAFTSLSGALPLILAVANGFGASTLLVAGVLIGEEDKDSLIRLMKKILSLALISSLILAAILFIFAGTIASFYVSKDLAVQYAYLKSAFRIYAISSPFSMLTILLISYYQCMEKSAYASLLSILENAVFIIGYSVILSNVLGVNAVWVSFVLAEISSLLVISLYSILKYKKLPILNRFLLLKEDFGVPKSERINYAIKTKNDIIDLSERIISFCEEKGIDHRRALFAGLAMEEMVVTIFENNCNQKNLRADVYLAHKNGELEIHLKDNGKQFDPVKCAETINPKDQTANIAVRLFYHIVKECDYQYVFNLNMLSFDI